MTSNHPMPLMIWATYYVSASKEADAQWQSKSQITSRFGLQCGSATPKLEIADDKGQHTAVSTFPGRLCPSLHRAVTPEASGLAEGGAKSESGTDGRVKS